MPPEISGLVQAQGLEHILRCSSLAPLILRVAPLVSYLSPLTPRFNRLFLIYNPSHIFPIEPVDFASEAPPPHLRSRPPPTSHLHRTS